MKKVSILLVAYNAEKYIAQAIESTLAQSFCDYEFLIVNDGSTDGTLNIINNYDDKRIRVIDAEHNYIRSLNLGLKQCKGKYVARMDADDIMYPKRIEKQVSLMESNSKIVVCTSWAKTFGEVEKIIGNFTNGYVDDIYTLFLLGNFLIHPTSMIQRRFLTRHRLLYKEYSYAEDFKLWADIARIGGKFYIIPQSLLHYRISHEQITNAFKHEQNATRLIIQQEIIEELLKRNSYEHRTEIIKLYKQMLQIHNMDLLSADAVIGLMYEIFQRQKIGLIKNSNVQL